MGAGARWDMVRQQKKPQLHHLFPRHSRLPQLSESKGRKMPVPFSSRAKASGKSSSAGGPVSDRGRRQTPTILQEQGAASSPQRQPKKAAPRGRSSVAAALPLREAVSLRSLTERNPRRKIQWRAVVVEMTIPFQSRFNVTADDLRRYDWQSKLKAIGKDDMGSTRRSWRHA